MRRCLLLTIATLAFTGIAAAADLPDHNGYVNDFAGRLSADDRLQLENKVRRYERASSNEVAVAIVKSLEGQTVEMYGDRLFKAWGIGKKDRNNGVLLVWAPVER